MEHACASGDVHALELFEVERIHSLDIAKLFNLTLKKSGFGLGQVACVRTLMKHQSFSSHFLKDALKKKRVDISLTIVECSRPDESDLKMAVNLRSPILVKKIIENNPKLSSASFLLVKISDWGNKKYTANEGRDVLSLITFLFTHYEALHLSPELWSRPSNEFVRTIRNQIAKRMFRNLLLALSAGGVPQSSVKFLALRGLPEEMRAIVLEHTER